MRFLIGAALAVLFASNAFAQQSYTAADLAAATDDNPGYYTLGDFGADAPPQVETRPQAVAVAPVAPPPPVPTRVAPQRERPRLKTVAELRMAPPTGPTYIVDARITPDVCARGGLTMSPEGCVIRSDRVAVTRQASAAPAPQSTAGWKRVNVDRAECQRRHGRPIFAGGYGVGYQYCLAPPGGLARQERTRRPRYSRR